MPEPARLPSKLKPTRQGLIVVMGLLVFGLLILGGLYLSPKAYPPAAPANVPPGVPSQKLRFVAYDLARQHPGSDPVFAKIAQLQPDYVLLQGVNEDDSVEIIEALGGQKYFHPQLYQRSEHIAGRRGSWGNLIVARQAVYDGSPVGGIRGGFGAWAASVVDGKKFLVADLHTAIGGQADSEAAEFEQAWKAKGSPPMVAAELPSEAAPPAGLGFLPIAAPASDGERFYLTKDWIVINSGAAVPGGGLVPRWIDVTAASSHATTAPAQ